MCLPNVTASGPIGEITTDEAMVDWLVTTAAADEKGDLVLGNERLDDGPGADVAAFAVISIDQSFDEFVGDFEGIVDEFLHL